MVNDRASLKFSDLLVGAAEAVKASKKSNAKPRMSETKEAENS